MGSYRQLRARATASALACDKEGWKGDPAYISDLGAAHPDEAALLEFVSDTDGAQSEHATARVIEASAYY